MSPNHLLCFCFMGHWSSKAASLQHAVVCYPKELWYRKRKKEKNTLASKPFLAVPFSKAKTLPLQSMDYYPCQKKYRDHCRRDKIATLLLHCPHYFLMIASRNPHHRRKLETSMSMGFLWKALQIQCSKIQHKNGCFAKKIIAPSAWSSLGNQTLWQT